MARLSYSRPDRHQVVAVDPDVPDLGRSLAAVFDDAAAAAPAAPFLLPAAGRPDEPYSYGEFATAARAVAGRSVRAGSTGSAGNEPGAPGGVGWPVSRNA